jgi:GTPase involved in cell partitioning and DNA repair
MKFIDEARIEVHAGKGGQWGSSPSPSARLVSFP